MRVLGFLVVAGCTGASSVEVSKPTTPTEPTTVTSGSTTVTFGECEGSGSYRRSADSGSALHVWAEVDSDGRIVAHLDNEIANCCPDPVATFGGEAPDLGLDFSDTIGSSGCDCACIFDFVATSAPYPAGDYTLRVAYDGEDQANLAVTVQ